MLSTKREFDIISESIGVNSSDIEEYPINEITKSNDYKQLSNELKQKKKEYLSEADEDYDFVRNNLRFLITKGMETIDNLIYVTQESENARMIESTSTFLKTIAEINESLINISDKKNSNKSIEQHNEQNIINNTAVFFGSTDELLEMIEANTTGKR